MIGFSLTLFGPEDGFQNFTYPKDASKIPENYNVTPQDFNFKHGGKIIQVIGVEDQGFYLSLHQQIYKIGSDRPGYTFGPGVLVSDKKILFDQFLTSVLELHSHFTKECVNELGKFNGPVFIGTYAATIDKKYEILKSDIQPSQVNSIHFNSLKNVNLKSDVACVKINSINNIQEVSNTISWFINSPASLMWKRLFLYEENSGEPVGNVRYIENIASEDLNFFALYAAQVSNLMGQKIEYEKRLIAYKEENSRLHNQAQELELKIRSNLQSLPQLRVESPRDSSANLAASQLSMLQGSIEGVIQPRVASIYDEVQKIKPQIKKIQSDLVFTYEKASLNFVLLVILILFALCAGVLSAFVYLKFQNSHLIFDDFSKDMTQMENRLISEINKKSESTLPLDSPPDNRITKKLK